MTTRKVARQPRCWPSRVAAGTPTILATVSPRNIVATARACRPSGTKPGGDDGADTEERAVRQPGEDAAVHPLPEGAAASRRAHRRRGARARAAQGLALHARRQRTRDGTRAGARRRAGRVSPPPAHTLNEVVLVRHGETDWSRAGRHNWPHRRAAQATPAARVRVCPGPPTLAARAFALVLTSPLVAGGRDAPARRPRPAARSSRERPMKVGLRRLRGTYYSQGPRGSGPAGRSGPTGTPRASPPPYVGARADGLLPELEGAEGDVAVFAHVDLLRVLGARGPGLPPAEGRAARARSGERQRARPRARVAGAFASGTREGLDAWSRDRVRASGRPGGCRAARARAVHLQLRRLEHERDDQRHQRRTSTRPSRACRPRSRCSCW